MLQAESRRTAGIILIVFPTVIYGGISLLTFLIDARAGYVNNPIRQNLFRAGHAHAGVLLVLSLVVLRYVDEAKLSNGWKQFVRSAVPSAAILLPAGFFFSILSPKATAPNRFIYLCFIGAAVLAVGLITLGVGLLRRTTQD
jgi:hypothetical protein